MKVIRRALWGALLILTPLSPAGARQGGGESTSPPPVSTPAERPGSGAVAAGRDPAPLLLSDLYAAARAQNPRLRAAGAAVAASRAREGGAGVPPDPMVEVGAMNLSLPGLRADMVASMAPSIQLMQTIPLPGKLALGREIAAQSTALAAAAEAESWWALRAQVAAAFYQLYEVDQVIALARENLGLLEELEAVARSLYAAGPGRQADLLRASVEVARARAELTRLEAGRRAAAARLNALVGSAIDDVVASPAIAPLPLTLPELDTLVSWAALSSPVLEGLSIRIERARAQRSLVRRELWPDLALGVQYGQSRGHDGTERMGGVTLGFSLPAFAGRRQLRARDEAAAHEEAVRAEYAAARAVIEARIHELVAGAEETRTLIELYRTEILPQAAAHAVSALAGYRAGTVDFAAVIEARTGHNTYLRELHALVAAYGATIAELESTIGRELSATGHILAEVP